MDTNNQTKAIQAQPSGASDPKVSKEAFGGVMMFSSILFFVLIGALIVAKRRATKEAHQKLVCGDCGTRGTVKKTSRGSLLVEIALWCFFLVPGFIYSLWRISSKHNACTSCGSSKLVPVDSPIGKKLSGKAA